jgi:hypothetical protein
LKDFFLYIFEPFLKKHLASSLQKVVIRPPTNVSLKMQEGHYKNAELDAEFKYLKKKA